MTPRLLGPALLLLAGALRWVDGRDGSLGDQPWRTFGDLVLLAALAAFVALVAGVRRVARHRGAATGALVATALGAVGAVVLPGPADEVSAAVVALGLVGSLAVLARDHRVSWLEPALATVGFAAVIADRDLLVVAGALLASAVVQPPEAAPRAPGSPVPGPQPSPALRRYADPAAEVSVDQTTQPE